MTQSIVFVVALAGCGDEPSSDRTRELLRATFPTETEAEIDERYDLIIGDECPDPTILAAAIVLAANTPFPETGEVRPASDAYFALACPDELIQAYRQINKP